jgi:hypothetical protein
MRRLAMVFALLVTALIPAFAQRPPDVDAFLDAFLAKDVDEVAKHLPTDIEKRIAELNPDQKRKLGRELLLAQNLEKDGGKVTRSYDSDVLLTVQENKDGDLPGQILLKRRICDGYQSLLVLSIKSKSDDALNDESFMVWMKYEDGNWRVTELQDPNSRSTLKLDEQTLLSGYVESTVGGNEAQAEGMLRTYNTALVTYRATYPDNGLPFNLEMLGFDLSDGPRAYHAALISNGYVKAPYEISGYRFNYTLVTDDPSRQYTITARPLRFGQSGNRSFYTDDSAVIRSTSEDRDATKDDDPV